MLCEVYGGSNFLGVWAALSALGLTMIMVMSGAAFVWLYQHPTFETWQYKSNAKYPHPHFVKTEIYHTVRGMCAASICPAIAIWMTHNGWSQAYCGWGPSAAEQYSAGYTLFTFFVVWFGTDFWSFYYHHLGHTTKWGWEQHKPHHQFPNPSPFAVIADDWSDQFLRATPIFLFPMMMPMNIDLVFFTFGLFFYAYGVYLHAGHELPFISAHNPIINTSFQHYIHHAKSIINQGFHTGFYFKIWDQLWGSTYKGECVCAECERAKGLRTREAWEKVEKHDYSCLLSPAFWMADTHPKGSKAL